MRAYPSFTTNQHYIASAREELGLSKGDLREIPVREAKPILKTITDKFCTKHNIYWWWEDLRKNLPHYSRRMEQAYTFLDRVVGNTEEKVWFVVEGVDIFRLYIGKVRDIQRVIGECPAFEYYLVACDFSWLICENHHDYLITVGGKVVENFQALLARLA